MMKAKNIIFPLLALFLFAAAPAFGNNCCPENKDRGTVEAIEPLQKAKPAPVTSLHAKPDAVVYRDITNNAFLHPAEMLMGRIPGVWVTGGYNFYQIRIRGAMGPPLLVLDGMQLWSYDDQSLNNLLWSIPTTDIDRIEVLKNAASAAIYGGRASNGVIVIHTLRGEEADSQ